MLNNIDLKQYINTDDYVDNTNKIRNAKHSSLIKKNIDEIQILRLNNQDMFTNDIESFKKLCIFNNSFLYNNYFDLFNRVASNEIDLEIMENFLKVLKKIEDGNIDQHEGSVEIGKLLKSLYIDSALKRGDNLDTKYNAEKKEIPKQETKNISWKQYKQKYI